jgi:hypothetical protein
MQVSHDEFAEWMQHPVTEKYREYLGKLRLEIMENWAAGMYTSESSEGTAQKNAVGLGQLQLLEDLLNLTHEEM